MFRCGKSIALRLLVRMFVSYCFARPKSTAWSSPVHNYNENFIEGGSKGGSMVIRTTGILFVVVEATGINKAENANPSTTTTRNCRINYIVALRAERFWPLREHRGSCRPTINRRAGPSDKGAVRCGTAFRCLLRTMSRHISPRDCIFHPTKLA